jgi:hypothetical protein
LIRNSFDFAVLEATADNHCQSRANAESEMCDKCIELDGKIEHYERVAASIPDQLTIDRIKELVEQTKAIKAALHPQQE